MFDPGERSSAAALIMSAVSLCCGCSGSSVDERQPANPGQSVPSGSGGSGTTTTAASSDCVEVRTSTVFSQTTTKTWDADSRVLTATSTNGTDTSTLKWRYRSDGQIIAYVGIDQQPFQHDYSYDEHGDRVDFYLSYPTAPDLMMPSSAEPWMGSTYANDYDGAGRLVASTATEYGAGKSSLPPNHSTFTEDAQGRCSAIDAGNYGQVTLSYDDAGRLTKVVKTAATLGFCANATTSISYDETGRVLQSTRECSGGNSGPNPGGSQVTTHTYHANGSETVDYVDGLTDVGDGRSSTTRSAACLAQDAAIGKPADARCFVGMPL
jgi:hypothetical protein